MTPRLLLACLAGTSLLWLPLSAQIFVGSDNFNDNVLTLDSQAGEQPGVWSFESNSSGGSWVETGQHLEHRNANIPSGSPIRGYLAWTDTPESISVAGGAGLSGGTPYSSNWTAQVSATNLLTGMASGYSLAGFEAFTRTDSNYNAYYGIYLHAGASGTNLQFEWGTFDGTDWTRNTTRTATADTEDVLLRMTFDSISKELVLDYSFNSGATFIAGTTFDLDGANAGSIAPYQGGIGLQLAAANSNTGLAIGTGQLTYDNFSVTAIPEPSTYAAIAGLGALGLAFWRRRAKAAA